MDREQEEIQHLGFLGILHESCNIVSSRPKIFSQITLALIIPLSTIYLAHIEISELLFSTMSRNEFILDQTPEGTAPYDRLSALLSSELSTFLLFKIAYFLFFTLLALLSTSAVVYAVACIFTARDLSLSALPTVVPTVWRRLIVTFFWNFFIMFAYNVASLITLLLAAVLLNQAAAVAFLAAFLLAYLAGFLYITVIWHLATVVSVLEESYGLNAMAKSQDLIKGKTGVAFLVFMVIGVCFFGVQLVFEVTVVESDGGGVGERVGYGIICVVVLSVLMLFGLVAQTIVYLVCKSYHHQNIDKSSLADHLGGYLGEYVPLKARDVQLERFVAEA